MMRPTVLPHSAIDEFAAHAELSAAQLHGPNGLYAVRAQALGKGAHVVLVLWDAPDWQLLAVKPPEDAAHLNTPEVLALVSDWPETVALMLSKSQRGAHYTWVDLLHRPANSLH